MVITNGYYRRIVKEMFGQNLNLSIHIEIFCPRWKLHYICPLLQERSGSGRPKVTGSGSSPLGNTTMWWLQMLELPKCSRPAGEEEICPSDRSILEKARLVRTYFELM